MKIKITLFLLCFGYFQNSFSQKIKGNVRANNLPIHNVEVINTNCQRTDEQTDRQIDNYPNIFYLEKRDTKKYKLNL